MGHSWGTVDVPTFFIPGDCDWITLYTLVTEYCEVIEAPQKDMITISNTGHSPFLDKLSGFCKAGKNVLLQCK